MTAYGRTKTTAENNLKTKLQNRSKTGHAGELTAMNRVSDAYQLWDARFAEQVADGRRSPTSLDTYRRVARLHVLPAIGELRLGEASTPRLDKVITEIKHRTGARPRGPAAASSPAS